MAEAKTKKPNGTKNKKTRPNLGYNIFYITAFIVMAIIGFLGNSFFAYEIFNSLFFKILYLLLPVALLAVRSIQVYFRQTALYGKIFALTYFNMFALVFAVRPFVSTRLWAIFLFCSFIIALVLLIILAFKYTNSGGYNITRFEPIIAAIPLLLLLTVSVIQSYVSAGKMWIPIVTIGVALAAIALCVFLKYFKDIPYFHEEHKSEFVFVIILLIAACFYISTVTVTTINYAFDKNPTAVSVEIVDKNISSGTRQITTFYLKVKVDGKEKNISVPVKVYHSKEIGDSLNIKLYSGALGYSYYIFEYMDTQ